MRVSVPPFCLKVSLLARGERGGLVGGRNIEGVRIGLTEAKGERTNQENQAQGTLNESTITHEAETRSLVIDRK